MKRFIGLVCLFSTLAGGSQAAGGPITLGEVAGQKWLKVTVGDLTVITDASESRLREWAAETAWFQNGLRTALPLPPGTAGESATLFLFKSDSTMRRFLPDMGKRPMLLSGLFSSVAGQNVGMIGLSGSRFEVRAKLFHEMTHWHLAGSGVDVPRWFQEGLAQVFESFTLQGDAFRIGHNVPELLHSVKIAGTPPVGPMLTQGALDYSRAGWKHGQTDLFYAQSWSLTHMLLFGAKGGNRQRFTGYLNALRTGMTGAEAFSHGFGVTPEVAREQLDVYVRVPSWKFVTLPLDRSITRESFHVAALPAAELYQQFGMLLLATGYTETAAQFITYACANDGTNPRNWELAGMLALSRQPVELLAADEAFERARSAASRNPWVYALLGSRLLEGLPPDGGLLAEDRLREAGDLFLAAGKLRSDFKPAIEAIAGVVLVSAFPRSEFRAMVREGQAAAACSPVVQLALADDEIRTGHPAPAAHRLEKLLARPSDLTPELLTKAREMLAIVQTPPPQ